MRLQELFLIESTEEDRALISLSAALYPIIMQNSSAEEYVNMGKIGDLVDTPLSALNDVHIELEMPDDFMKRSEDEDDSGKDLSEVVRIAFWDPSTESVVLNLKYISRPTIRRTLTHELRHALDDVKSDYKASSSDRYMTAKKKSHRASPDTAYLAKPGEINARYTQTMHLIVLKLEKLFQKFDDVDKIRSEIMDYLSMVFETNQISHLFPEKEKSRDYKRLIKRAVDFIEKEIKYNESQSKNSVTA